MLTLPTIVERKPQFYVAVKDRVTFSEMKPAVDRAFPMLFGWVGRTGVQPAGAAFFRYNVIDMAGKLEIEFSVPVTERVEGEGDIIAGTLPPGRYGQITWTGPYDALLDVNAVLIGWAREKGIRWDMAETPEGDRFAARFEIYENDPSTVESPQDLITTVAIKIAE